VLFVEAPAGADTPDGWWAVTAVRALPGDEEEEAEALVCSPACARAYFERWQRGELGSA